MQGSERRLTLGVCSSTVETKQYMPLAGEATIHLWTTLKKKGLRHSSADTYSFRLLLSLTLQWEKKLSMKNEDTDFRFACPLISSIAPCALTYVTYRT